MKKYINLLPPQDQAALRLTKTSWEVLNFGVFAVLSIVILTAILFVGSRLLEKKLGGLASAVAERQQELQGVQSEVLKQEIEDLNQTLENFQRLNGQTENFSPLFRELARALPSDLTLDSLAITRSDQKVEISGRSATRNAVLKLRENLLASEYFRNVNFPLANLEKPVDVKWSYKFYINPDKLKK